MFDRAGRETKIGLTGRGSPVRGSIRGARPSTDGTGAPGARRCAKSWSTSPIGLAACGLALSPPGSRARRAGAPGAVARRPGLRRRLQADGAAFPCLHGRFERRRRARICHFARPLDAGHDSDADAQSERDRGPMAALARGAELFRRRLARAVARRGPDGSPPRPTTSRSRSIPSSRAARTNFTSTSAALRLRSSAGCPAVAPEAAGRRLDARRRAMLVVWALRTGREDPQDIGRFALRPKRWAER